ncbi:MAG: RecX family transcriptional regulator [Bacteroidota bacterium]
MRITAIEPQKKDPARKNLIVNGKFLFGISTDVLIQLGLRRGDQVDESLIAKIHAAEELFQAKRKALDYLSRRMHSEKELNQKLQKKGFSADTILRLIDDFRSSGYLNDTQFAVAYVTDCLQKRPIGRRSLFQRLRLKGIHKEIIDNVLTATLETQKEETIALAVARKKLRVSRSQFERLDLNKQKQRLAQFLAQRGFEWEIIGHVVNEVLHKE